MGEERKKRISHLQPPAESFELFFFFIEKRDQFLKKTFYLLFFCVLVCFTFIISSTYYFVERLLQSEILPLMCAVLAAS